MSDKPGKKDDAEVNQINNVVETFSAPFAEIINQLSNLVKNEFIVDIFITPGRVNFDYLGNITSICPHKFHTKLTPVNLPIEQKRIGD